LDDAINEAAKQKSEPGKLLLQNMNSKNFQSLFRSQWKIQTKNLT